MDTREIAVEYRLAHWAGIVKERSESGLTIRDYCKDLGIHENAYYYWLKKLRKAACDGISEIGNRTCSMTSPIFAEVKLPEQSALSPFGGVQQSHICVEAAGVRISADSGYPVGKLTELIKTVMSPC